MKQNTKFTTGLGGKKWSRVYLLCSLPKSNSSVPRRRRGQWRRMPRREERNRPKSWRSPARRRKGLEKGRRRRREWLYCPGRGTCRTWLSRPGTQLPPPVARHPWCWISCPLPGRPWLPLTRRNQWLLSCTGRLDPVRFKFEEKLSSPRRRHRVRSSSEILPSRLLASRNRLSSRGLRDECFLSLSRSSSCLVVL